MTLQQLGRQRSARSPAAAALTGGRRSSPARAGIRAHASGPRHARAAAGRPGRPARARDVYVVDTGSPYPDAPTLLLFHGLATTSYLTWFTILDDLRQHYRVVMFDQRWHGRGIRLRLPPRRLRRRRRRGAGRARDRPRSSWSATRWAARWPRSSGAGTAHRRRASCWAPPPALEGEPRRRDLLPVLGWPTRRLPAHYRRRVAACCRLAARVPRTGTDLSAVGVGGVPQHQLVVAARGAGRARARSTPGTWLARGRRPDRGGRHGPGPGHRARRGSTRWPRRSRGATVFEAPGGHASVVFDVERWRPVFLEAVAHVAGRVTLTALVG